MVGGVDRVGVTMMNENITCDDPVTPVCMNFGCVRRSLCEH
ncbi:hypothetical protein P10159_3277 [Citrobacter portucalensis]|nr:hypothetical protein P10159_3277 [Citrobacter portucalensis]